MSDVIHESYGKEAAVIGGPTCVFRPLSAACACILIATASIGAQVPVGADTLSQSAVADSQRVLRHLDSVVTRNQKDAAAWYRRGMVAWALYLRAEAQPPLKGLDMTTIRRVADTSLMIAADLVPSNAGYQLDAGELLRSATDIGPRQRGMNYIERGYALAYKTQDVMLRARASLGRGRQAWLSYEVNVNRFERFDCVPTKGIRKNPAERPIPMGSCPDTPCYDLGASLAEPARGETRPELEERSGMAYAKSVHNLVIDCFTYPRSRADIDYARSETFFREAYAATPTDRRAARHLAMLLAERARWKELATMSHDWTLQSSDDGWAWLTLGLGLHRGGDEPGAVAALERGIAKLERREQQRLFSFARLLDRQDSIAFVATDSTQRIRRENMFWQMTDPLWSRSGNETRSEFIARVAYAELRWSVEERGVRGADSDRGEIHIRYGPPTAIGVLRGAEFPDVGGGLSSASVVTFWDYDGLGKAFVFWGNPSYGTARFPAGDGRFIAEIVDDRPTSFDNVPKERIIDLPTRIVRFRGLADSTDLLVVLSAPVDTMRAASSVDTPPRLDFWLSPRDITNGRTVRDSATMRGTGIGRLVYRVPSNNYFYRLEATADGSMVAARDMGWITAGRDTMTGFNTRGFGLSDLLLASDARPNKATPSRWTDFSVAPVTRSIPKGGTLQIVWENYELGVRDGQAQYSIEMSIERTRGAASRIAAEVVGALAGAIGVDRTVERVAYKFERAAPHSPAIVDFVSLALKDTPTGTYRLTVSVVDRFTGRTTRATSQFAIEGQ